MQDPTTDPPRRIPMALNGPTRILARTRSVLASPPSRRALVKRLAAVAVALAVLMTTASARIRAETLRQHWDATVEVYVARHDIDLGSPIGAEATARELRPASLVPAGALESAPPPGSVATSRMLAGEALVADRVSRPGESRSSVPAGRAGVDLPLGSVPTDLRTGDHVDVLTGPAEPLVGFAEDPDPSSAPEALIVTTDAIVLAVATNDRGAVVTVGVAERDLPATAAASLGGQVILVTRNPGDD